MKILLHQTAFLGDIVLSTPVIGALCRLYPDAELSVLTTPLGAELLKCDPRIKHILVDDKKGVNRSVKGILSLVSTLKSFEFDVVYALHKSWRTSLVLWLTNIPRRVGFQNAKLSFLYSELRDRDISLHDVQRNLQLIDGASSAIDILKLFPAIMTPQERATLLGGNDIPYIVIAPGSVWKTKRWSEKHFKDLVELISKKIQIVLVGSQEERSLAEFVRSNNAHVINLCGVLSLGQTLSIVSTASAVICNDSMMLHVASSFKRPVVALFCATSPSFGFGPWQTPYRILESQTLSCKPCLRHGSHVCPTGTERCRTDVSVNQVIHALRELECQI